MGVTEFGPMVVKPGVDAMDETTEAGKIVATAYKGVASEKTGPYCVYYGMEVENPDNFWGFFDFDSIEDHIKFAKERGVHIVKGLDKVFDRPGFHVHLGNEAFPPTALKSPVTEIMMAYFASDISPEAKAAGAENIAQFKAQGLDRCSDVQAVNFGWNLETDFSIPGGEEDQKAAALTLLIGWPSIDAHMQFRETEAFKETVGLLRSMEGVLKITMCHVKCKVVENEVRRP